jgi:hypothetical protein
MEKLLNRLEICLKYISDTNSELQQELSKERLLEVIDELLIFTFMNESDLFILRQLTTSFYAAPKDDFVSKNICLLDCKRLVRRFDLDPLIFESWSKKINSVPEEDQFFEEIEMEGFTDNSYKYYKWKSFDTESFQHSKLLLAANRILNKACQIIDYDLFHNRRFEDQNTIWRRDTEEFMTKSTKENNFYDEFIECKATLNDWKTYPNTGFRTHYEQYYDTTQEVWTKINNHQQKLFGQAVKLYMDILISDVTNLPYSFQLNNARTHLAIISKFMDGEYSSLDLKRINKIIEFSEPDEVILELDDMKRYDVYNYDNFLPFDGPNKKKSSRLVATLLIEYQEFLNVFIAEILEKSPKSNIIGIPSDFSDETIKSNDLSILPKPMAFKLKFKPKREEILKTVIRELWNYDIVDIEKNSSDDLINILLCSDFREIDKPINFGTNTNFCCKVIKEFFPYFENMNAASLQQSKLFKTKNDTFLSQSNFNKSVNGFSKKEKELNEIKKIIRQLEEKNSKSSNN